MAARETKRHNKEEKAVHKVTPAERIAVDKHFARREAKPSVRFKVCKNGSDPQIALDHPNKPIGEALLMGSLASADCDFVNGIVYQLANASGQGQDIDEHGSISCCPSSKVLSRGISSRQCLRPRWRPCTWRA